MLQNLAEILNIDDNLTSKLAMAVFEKEEEKYTYGDLRDRSALLRGYFKKMGISKGDRIVLVSENRPHWAMVYLSTVSYGATIVPILVDFAEPQMTNIIDHSGASIVVVSKKQRPKVEAICEKNSLPLIEVEELTALLEGADWEPTPMETIDSEDIAAILYTSGTTGLSKGVMLTHKNLASNVHACMNIHHITFDDRFLSLLPLAHTYECTIGMLFPLSEGASITYLGDAPTPRVLLKAMAEVKPTTVLSVPLLIEKIYRKNVAPSLTKSFMMRSMMKFPPLRKLFHSIGSKKLQASFGGAIRFFGIGGAALAPDVERFLSEGKFPYSIGYGLTETAPLLAGARPDLQLFRSTGPAVDGVTLRIADANPETGVGEIQATGPNIMKGYYKDPEKTAEVFTKDGWFKTGDLGIISKKSSLYIRGRLKNLILGANGENIYPEEIESVLNENSLVAESLTLQKGKEIVALIYINTERWQQEWDEHMTHLKHTFNKVTKDVELMKAEMEKYKEEMLEKVRKEVNNKLAPGSRLTKIIEQANPFEKTPSLKIKRYLYI